MSYGGYEQYGGNPYGDVEQGGAGGYTASQPYQSTGGYGASNPYGSQGVAPQQQYQQQPIHLQPTQSSTYPSQQPSQQPSGAMPPMQTRSVMSDNDFLARIDHIRNDIKALPASITEISNLHQQMLGSPDNSKTAQLDAVVNQTQIRNTSIRDQIRQLEADTAKSQGNTMKNGQIASVKKEFKNQLTSFSQEERQYRDRYRDQIKRQYKIVNPNATEAEADEASRQDWGDEGVFQTALKSNRSATATTTLSSVRARHADIEQIEKTLLQLQELFNDLGRAVEAQEPAVDEIDRKGDETRQHLDDTNVQLGKAKKSAARYRKGKWICFFIVLAIIAVLALVLGLYFGLRKTGNNNNSNGQ